MHDPLLTRPLVLASASPRRAQLLAQLALTFHVLPTHEHEPPPAPRQDIGEWACHTALWKARAAAAALPPADRALVLAADTVVLLPAEAPQLPTLRGAPVQVLGKPRDAEDARRMLRLLSGRAHVVVSAFALLAHPEGTVVTDLAETIVHFRSLADEEIAGYVAGGEPLDKAGAYGIQGQGAVLVETITGDYFTVVGLPLARLWLALAPWRAPRQ